MSPAATHLQTLSCTQCQVGPAVSQAASLFSAVRDQASMVSTGGQAYQQHDLQSPRLLPSSLCRSNFNLYLILEAGFPSNCLL